MHLRYFQCTIGWSGHNPIISQGKSLYSYTHKKGIHVAFCDHTDEPWGHCGKWKTQGEKKKIKCSHLYVENKKPESSRELCPLFCNNFYGKRIWKRMDTCICIFEPICCTSETNTVVNQLCVLSHFSFDASPHHTLSQGSEKCVKVLVALSGPDLCDPMDCSLPGSLVQRILQARAWEWVVPFSRGSSQPKDRTHVSSGSCIASRFFLPLSHQGSPVCKYKIKIILNFFSKKLNHRNKEQNDGCQGYEREMRMWEKWEMLLRGGYFQLWDEWAPGT